MYPYPPTIEYEEYEHGGGLRAAQDSDSSNQSQKGATGCGRSESDPESEETTKAKVVKLTVKGGSVESTTFLVPKHPPVATDDPKRPCFAPKMESCTISWQLEKGDLVTDAIIQVFHRDSGSAIYVKELTRAEIDQQSGEILWDGKVIEGARGFPAGYLNVSSSPYKVRITLHGEVDEAASMAWTYFDVLIASIDLEWGAYDLLDPERTDIADEYKEKILGGAEGGDEDSEAGFDDEDSAPGLEEALLNDLKSADPTPSVAVKHDVVLLSNLFAKRDEGETSTTEFANQSDYDAYNALWGNGPRIPIVATVKVKTAAGTGTTDAPEALAGAKLLWDWQDNEPDRWKTPLTPGETPFMTESFLNASYHKNSPTKPAVSCNAPVHFGGKLGNGGPSVFPPVAKEDVFPFEVGRCNTRTWASLSSFPEIHTDGATYEPGQEPYRTGVIFQPSRMAGDKYNVSVQLYFEPEFDSDNEIETTAPAVTKAGEFEVFRKVNLKYLVYGAPDLGCDADACLTTTAALFKKEANLILDYEKVTISKADYETALRATLDTMLSTPKLYRDIGFQTPISYKYFISNDIPANAPPFVYKEKTYLDELETAYKNGRVQHFKTVGNRSNFLLEKVTGAAGGYEGVVLCAMASKVDSPLEVFFEDPNASFVDGETIAGFASGTRGNVELLPQQDFWCVVYNDAESDHKSYKNKIDVKIGNTVVTVEYPRIGIKRNYSPEVSDTAKAALRSEILGNDRNMALTIKITSKSGASPRALERLKKLKEFLAECAIDRKAIFLSQRDGYDSTVHNALGVTGFVAYKQFPQTALPILAQEYIKANYPDDEAIFFYHLPGRTNIKDLQWATEATRPYQETQLAGALFAAESTRKQAILYISSLPDGPKVKSTPSKKHEAIFAHEIAHALFLPHAKHRTGNDPGEVVEKKHVKGDTCVMNYDLDSERFCGLCMMRLRGWKTDPGEFAAGTDQLEYHVELRLGDVNDLFAEDVGTSGGKMARLQALGLFSRPLDHPEADACLSYSWDHAEEVFPNLVGAADDDVRDELAAEIRKFLVGGDVLPASGQYARFHTPLFPLLYALNYLEAKIPANEQGTAEAKPFENFTLGADPRKVEEAYFKSNPALGLLPLEVEVKARPKGSTIPWTSAEPARLVSVYFELVDAAIAAAPAGPATLVVAGATSNFTNVVAPALTAKQKSFIDDKTGKVVHEHEFRMPLRDGGKKVNWKSGGTTTVCIHTNQDGIATVNFKPSLIAGDAYKFRAYVGPDTQDAPTVLGEDMVESGTLVHWRSLRVCNHVRMASPAAVGGIPDCLKQDGALYSENYSKHVGALPALDLAGHITQEFAKSNVEVLLESGADAPTDLSTHEADFRAEITALLTDFPAFNQTSSMKGRRSDSLSIFREVMTPDPDGKTFRLTLSGKPEKGTLTVRPEGGGPGSAVLEDASGAPVAKPVLESHSVNYDTRVVEIKYAAPPAKPHQVCYKIEEFLDVDTLLAPIPATSPFLFNLTLPRAYNAAIGDGTMPMQLGDDERLSIHTSANPHYFAASASTLGLVTGLLMTALWRAIDKNKGFSPGLTIIEAASMDNYTATPDDAGTQEGKAVGQAVYLFGGNGAEAAKYNALAIHEISHGLYLQHAPGVPTANGTKIEQHETLSGQPDDVPCVMSYDVRSDGHHCGKCVANLRGIDASRL